jgi:hypothetical protein
LVIKQDGQEQSPVEQSGVEIRGSCGHDGAFPL